MECAVCNSTAKTRLHYSKKLSHALGHNISEQVHIMKAYRFSLTYQDESTQHLVVRATKTPMVNCISNGPGHPTGKVT